MGLRDIFCLLFGLEYDPLGNSVQITLSGGVVEGIRPADVVRNHKIVPVATCELIAGRRYI